jgi:hypothetical protein
VLIGCQLDGVPQVDGRLLVALGGGQQAAEDGARLGLVARRRRHLDRGGDLLDGSREIAELLEREAVGLAGGEARGVDRTSIPVTRSARAATGSAVPGWT